MIYKCHIFLEISAIFLFEAGKMCTNNVVRDGLRLLLSVFHVDFVHVSKIPPKLQNSTLIIPH